MKNYFFLYLAILSLCFFSCKKQHSSNGGVTPPAKTYKVNISTSADADLATKATGSKLKTNSATINVSDYLTMLYFWVFDSTGKQVAFLQQDSTAANFGQISENLTSGTYTIQIAAGKSNLGYENNPGLSIDYNGGNGVWGDTFFGSTQLTVNGDVNQNITLNRIVGQLQVVINDVLPANAAKIGIKVIGELKFYKVATATPNTVADAYTVITTIPAEAKGHTNYMPPPIEIVNTVSPLEITVSCYDASDNLLASASVNDVSFQVNRKTILSGQIFGADNGFTIKVNPWAPPINIPFNIRESANN